MEDKVEKVVKTVKVYRLDCGCEVEMSVGCQTAEGELVVCKKHPDRIYVKVARITLKNK